MWAEARLNGGIASDPNLIIISAFPDRRTNYYGHGRIFNVSRCINDGGRIILDVTTSESGAKARRPFSSRIAFRGFAWLTAFLFSPTARWKHPELMTNLFRGQGATPNFLSYKPRAIDSRAFMEPAATNGKIVKSKMVVDDSRGGDFAIGENLGNDRRFNAHGPFVGFESVIAPADREMCVW
jgi:hypothetical protein